MNVTLSKKEYVWTGEGPVLKWDFPIGYEVKGMPPGYEAWINNFGAPCADDWQILIIKNSVSAGWFGEYVNPDAALAAIRGYVIEFVN
ncbi:MAG TPA: hypothetical protein VNY05_30540 [Candidatus Acidoferrales bacterium]|jgi:hypothetical protein|nr:hypothetical protein [Candidatus Acidoferrales bacterium]